MFNERIPLKNGRALSRKPSQEIDQLMQIRARLIDTQGGGICPSSPINMIGVLIMEERKVGNADLFKRDGLNVPFAVETPVQLLSDVSIFNFFKGAHEDTGLKAKTVFYKTPGASGIKGVGVVIEGSMAGLYTRPVDEDDLSRGMTALRIGNDRRLELSDRPYSTEIANPYADSESSEGLRRARFFSGILQRIDFSTQGKFDELVGVMKKDSQEAIYSSALFFDLCRQLGIKVDEDLFHLTRRLAEVS